jgi:molybdate transport system substrate-binding protein
MIVRMRKLTASFVLAAPWLLLTLGAVAQEAPVKIVATIAVEGAFREIEPLLTARAGLPVTVEFATTAALVERLTNGETADLAVLTKEAVQHLAAKGHVRSSTDLVLSVIGIAVADDAPPPAMKTTADFVAFMKATPSIAYTVRGVSGVHMAQLIERLGLSSVVKPKAIVVDGFSGTLLREGKVAAAVQQLSELKFAGASNVVPLPDEIQVQTIFTVAVLNGKQADATATIVRVLTSTEAAAAYERSGASPLFK